MSTKKTGYRRFAALGLFALTACATGVNADETNEDDGAGGSYSNSVSTAATVGPATVGPTSNASSSGQTNSASSSTNSSSSGGGGDELPICDSGFVLPNTPTDAPCASCMSNYCCQEHKDCAGDSNCMACLTQMNGPACDATLTDDAVFACVLDLCSNLCGHLFN
jgi:hypothetical protein